MLFFFIVHLRLPLPFPCCEILGQLKVPVLKSLPNFSCRGVAPTEGSTIYYLPMEGNDQKMHNAYYTHHVKYNADNAVPPSVCIQRGSDFVSCCVSNIWTVPRQKVSVGTELVCLSLHISSQAWSRDTVLFLVV